MSDPLLPYPNEWMQLLRTFGSCFSKPQFGNFCQAATGIAVSEHSSISRFSGLFTPKHQSSLNDFFTESPWEDAKTRDQLSRITLRNARDASIGIIDDTLGHHKYAEKIQYVGWFRDGMSGEKEKGHSIVTHCVHSPTLGCVPFDAEMCTGDGRTKNDIAMAMVARTQRHAKLRLYLLDSWYSGKELLGYIKSKNSHYITEVKSNRNATIDKKRRFVREHLTGVKKWAEGGISGSHFRWFQTEAFMEGLGTVNLVFSQRMESEGWGETFYITTDVRSLRAERVIELFLLRGGVEGFHREAKQQLGLEDNLLRNGRGIARYLFLVLLVYVLLLLLGKRRAKETLEKLSIGELREEVKAACYTTLLRCAKKKPPKWSEQMAKALARGM